MARHLNPPSQSVMRQLCREVMSQRPAEGFTAAWFHGAYFTRFKHDPMPADVHRWLDAAEFVQREGKDHFRLVETPPPVGSIWRRADYPPAAHLATVKVVSHTSDGFIAVHDFPTDRKPPYLHHYPWGKFLVEYDPWVPSLWERLSV